MHTDNEQDTLPLVPKGIAAEAGGTGPVLIGGHCPHCRRDFFPRPRYCPGCMRPPQERLLSGDGVIYSYTVVRIRPPLGLPQPYAVGFVDLNQSGLRIFGLLNHGDIDRLAIGKRVRLKLGPLGQDGGGQACMRPYFSLVAAEGDDD
ncbi:MAG: OB-fold domain-containing protein [Desulfarculaceae bacterium]|nr:OB-fold domain-containing protein [Desulfarculaceae bacterium]MCF8047907.1 OB-fold domain-containing protein [Desulfarculaceae bacterium]MCF8064428.1 OB-fold domain-containing protein [Desulfarculaceae bacterium]MCF8097629.1 OB-fold domain-containing protein [Desulfarculaceae bacterium]MCF8122373.1 OB-fold domain-containing protein [Desulfarculaceae bacterium]